ncbi:MATE family efflux transporter [Leptolyngbya sp. FACHB-711]|uniref:MATE family efflux transporter n=1 Tax=unclassified Leptolyngbya TaxID=2650499 RepID=UPI0016839419|nr:MATE family efflux transporter [Leptolyngbya sp. FACHB-711]MBD1851274.1 MATE family efflux transporter [Cyanobacteria bacterium FACHB-502]MBD2026969.1 MATE family efflux transporter [Leptolyngbya sp. FACHB-711]
MLQMTRSQLTSEVRASLTLAVPLAGAQLAQAATGFVDTVMMGLLGGEVLAAGGLGATTFQACLLVSSSIVSAVSPLAASAFGAGQTREVGRVVQQGMWLAMLMTLPLMLLLAFPRPLFLWLGQSESVTVQSAAYLQAIVWGFPAGLGFAVLRHFVSALSQPRPVIVIMVCGTLFNIAGNYVLMFGKLGLPALGLAGIGYASSLSLWAMFLALLFYCQQPRYQQYGIFQNLHVLEGRLFRELLHVGIPIGILTAAEAGLFTVTTFLMGQLGTVTLAAHQIALQTAAITFMIPLGVSFATTVLVGQRLGQGDFRGAKRAGYTGMGLGVLFMAAMAMLFWTVPEAIVSLYLDINDPANQAVVLLAEQLLGVAAMFQIVDGLQVTAVGALRGLKDTRVPMLIGLIAYWGLGLSCGYLLGLRLGYGGMGLWWGLAIGLAFAASILTWRFSTTVLRTVTPHQRAPR